MPCIIRPAKVAVQSVSLLTKRPATGVPRSLQRSDGVQHRRVCQIRSVLSPDARILLRGIHLGAFSFLILLRIGLGPRVRRSSEASCAAVVIVGPILIGRLIWPHSVEAAIVGWRLKRLRANRRNLSQPSRAPSGDRSSCCPPLSPRCWRFSRRGYSVSLVAMPVLINRRAARRVSI